MSKKQIDSLNLKEINLREVITASETKAKRHFAAAETLATNGFHDQGYILLVFSIEESAKATLVGMYDSFKNDLTEFENNTAFSEHFTEEKAKTLFYAHEEKHITIASQAILRLLNIFDMDKRSKIIQALREKNLNLVPEITKILRIFKNMEAKRLQASFSELIPSPKINFGKKYEELKPHALAAIDEHNGFRVLKSISYPETEKYVNEMMKLLNNEQQ